MSEDPCYPLDESTSCVANEAVAVSKVINEDKSSICEEAKETRGARDIIPRSRNKCNHSKVTKAGNKARHCPLDAKCTPGEINKTLGHGKDRQRIRHLHKRKNREH